MLRSATSDTRHQGYWTSLSSSPKGLPEAARVSKRSPRLARRSQERSSRGVGVCLNNPPSGLGFYLFASSVLALQTNLLNKLLMDWGTFPLVALNTRIQADAEGLMDY